MEKEKKLQIICVIIGILIFSAIGFYLGRKTINSDTPKTEIVYIKGENITDSIPYPVPYEVIKPADTADIIRRCVRDGIYSELFPEKIITEYVEITKDDTTEIIRDWGTKRLYSEQIFDIDTVGQCTINASIQYNRLTLLSYSYIPVTKVTTITNTKVKLFSPYIGAGVLVNNDISDYMNLIPTVSAGFFIKERYGINVQYGKMLKNKNNLYGISLLYKF